MSQTPRKFSEKIAILERKSRAEADDFSQVMQDVKKITTTGRSPQTTPSSTPYPCSPTGPGSSSTNQTPSATESPIGLMPDGYNLGTGGNNLYVNHPLAGMNWQRSGGSLPNVHQMVQQNPGQMPQMPTNPNEQWMYWQAAQTSGVPNQTHSQNHHPRTRSPGSAHFHPYRSSSGNVAQAAQAAHRNERIPTLDSHMMHLQPPDPSWSNARARSDPAIHMNTMQALYYTPNNPNGAQFLPNNQQQAQFQQAQFQQAQWAQMNGMPQNPGFYNANGSVVASGNGQITGTNQTGSQLNNGQVSAQTPTQSQPGSTASSASSVPICMSSSPQNQQSQVQSQAQLSQYNGYLKQSPCGSPDMAVVGSLPNMHSPSIIQQQQQYKTEQTPSYYDYEYDPNQQQPLQSAPATMQQYCNGGSIYAYNQSQIPQSQSQQQSIQNPQYMRPQHQLTMPPGMGSESSQSAPTSPAQSFTNNPLQPQWTSTRHYSASPDNNQGIPRVTLTRVEGNTECFQEEFQDLCLDSDLQGLIQGAEDHFDPATETQLINSTR